MRSIVYQALSTDVGLLALTSTFLTGDVDTPAGRPFVNLRWGIRNPGLNRTFTDRQDLAIWVHDKPNDYQAINSIIKLIREVLTSIEDRSDDGGHVTVVRWSFDSADLVDDGHRTIVRNTNYQVIGRGVD